MKFVYLLYLVILKSIVEIISTPDDVFPWGTLVFASCAAWWIRKRESEHND